MVAEADLLQEFDAALSTDRDSGFGTTRNPLRARGPGQSRATNRLRWMSTESIAQPFVYIMNLRRFRLTVVYVRR